ncbi:hypothetical protein OAS27_05360 [Alphaproteobacteria bacterium]|nr:hypothetical protein [Alphaproteobacteria bacterium]
MQFLKHKLDPAYFAIIILAIFLYVGYDKLIENILNETARETINSAIGVIFVIITTMYMLNKQTEVESKKELNSEIFKKKISSYEYALSLWQKLGFLDDELEQKDRAACIEIQLTLMMIAPTEVAKCANGITHTIINRSEKKPRLNEEHKEKLFDQLCNFSRLVRKDLALPDTSLDLDPKLVTNMGQTIKKLADKNYDQFLFDGQQYGKNRLVLAVVRHVVEVKKPQNFYELEEFFPKVWHSSGKPTKSKQAGIIFRKDLAEMENLRFFEKPEELINLPDGSSIVVNNQWGKNIDFFVDKVTETFGIEIKRNSYLIG